MSDDDGRDGMSNLRRCRFTTRNSAEIENEGDWAALEKFVHSGKNKERKRDREKC